MSGSSPDPATEATIAALLARFFAAVSFPEGGYPNYDRLLDLFTAQGRLIRASNEFPLDLSVSEFVADRHQAMATGYLTVFHEAELTGRTDVFGRVGQRFSSYEKRGVMNGAPFEARGMISSQLVLEPSGWRISSMAWDDERPGLSFDEATP